MTRIAKNITLALLPLLLLSLCSAQIVSSNYLHLRAQLVSVCNFALFVSCLFCIKQYFWPGDTVRQSFQLFNLVAIIVFYCLSLPFLINNIPYYSNNEQLTPISVIGKFFFSTDPGSIMQWVIIATAVINILYILKYRKDYLTVDIPEDYHEPAIQANDGFDADRDNVQQSSQP